MQVHYAMEQEGELFLFFFNDTATTEIYTLSLHDALPICSLTDEVKRDAEALWTKLLALYNGGAQLALGYTSWGDYFRDEFGGRSEEHTSELQSRLHLVCRLLLEKKKKAHSIAVD